MAITLVSYYIVAVYNPFKKMLQLQRAGDMQNFDFLTFAEAKKIMEENRDNPNALYDPRIYQQARAPQLRRNDKKDKSTGLMVFKDGKLTDNNE